MDFLSLAQCAAPDQPPPNQPPADRAQPPARLWVDRFAQWAPGQIAAAEGFAAAKAKRVAAGLAEAHWRRVAQDAAVARAWLDRRALELCGTVVPNIGDLFDPAPAATDWRACALAEQRLAGFAADPSVTVARRRDAAESLSHFRAITAMQRAWPPPAIRTLGMLMLCP